MVYTPETGAAVPGFTAGAVSGAPAGYNATEIADKMHTAERSLPNPLLPDFWAVLALAVVVTLHALVWFIQRWSIHVRARVQYTKHPRLESGQYAHVTPHAHQVQSVQFHDGSSSFFSSSFSFSLNPY